MADGSRGRIGRIVGGTLASVLLGAFVASAQNPPLAEVARKEEERRKTTKPATKVLTNKDLPAVSAPAPVAQSAPPSDAAPVPAQADKNKSNDADEKSKSEEKPKDEAWWRARITEPREQLYRDQVLLEALQSRVNGLTRDFVGRDDPY